MGFINEIVKTVIDTGKKAIQKEVKEQTENTIESVSNKVTSTINDVGDKFESGVKTSLDSIGKKEENAQVMPQNISNNVAMDTYNRDVKVTPVLDNNQSTVKVAPIIDNSYQNVSSNQGSNMEKPTNNANTSIAGDVANILEKKNIMDKSEVANTASVVESELVNKINEVTDALNTMYDKDTTLNDNTKDLTEAFSHLVKATNNIGNPTNNEIGKVINDVAKDNPGFNEGLNELNKESVQVINKVQEGIDNFKDVN